MEETLVSLFRSSSRSQRRRGKSWYDTMTAHCDSLAGTYGVSRTRVACIVGITSPRCQLAVNLARTERALRGEQVRGFSYMDEAVQAPLARINGPKVVPFAKAILGDRDALVLDTWALAAVGVLDKPTAEQRKQVDAAYRAAAKRCRQTVRDFQAIIWIAVREQATRSNGVAYRNADIHELIGA